MNYTQARGLIQSGDLLAWSGETFIGRVIKVWTRGKYSHVGIAVWLGSRLYVVELREFRGAQIVPLSNTKNFEWVKADVNWSDGLEDYALSKIGLLEYGYMNVVRAAFGLNSRGNRMQCAQFAEALYIKAGVLKKNTTDTPSKIVKRIKRASKTKSTAFVEMK